MSGSPCKRSPSLAAGGDRALSPSGAVPGVYGGGAALSGGEVPGGKTAFEQLLDVDLAAGSGEGIEIQIVNMDIPLLVGLGMLGLENEHQGADALA